MTCLFVFFVFFLLLLILECVFFLSFFLVAFCCWSFSLVCVFLRRLLVPVEHILLTCSDFIEIRESHFTAKSLRMLFKDISPEKIFNFEIVFSYVCVFIF